MLTVTEMLRKLGVVGKFVEFYGPGLSELSLADRATIANMAPEYGATCGIFPVDDETLRYLRLTGRPEAQIALVEAYYREQGLFRTEETPEADYTQTIELDLATVEPSVAGPKRPQDRVLLKDGAGRLPRAAALADQPQSCQIRASARPSVGREKADTLRPTADVLSTVAAIEPGVPVYHVGERRERSQAGLDRPCLCQHCQRALRRGPGSLSRPRVNCHRRDYELHQHLQPLRDGRGRACREEGCPRRASAYRPG